MNEKDREKVALFRYGIIAPILNGQVSNRQEYFAELAGKVHQVPYYGNREFTPKTLSSWLLAYSLLGKEAVPTPERKRFAYDKVNTLWQGDTSVGPYLSLNGRKVKTFLFAFIDDASRLVPFAKFTVSEKYEDMRDILKEALIRRGIPKIVYVDNGKIYRCDTLQVACASLGIALAHTQPYDAPSKGYEELSVM